MRCAARGNEYGAVTGRPRRCGWLDIPLLRYSNQVNGAKWLVVTKLDVLDDLAEIPVCIGYEIGGKVSDEIPADVQGLEQIKPRYTTLKGWRQSTEGYYRVRQAAASRARLPSFSGARERSKDRDGLNRPRPRPDHRAARVCRDAGAHEVVEIRTHLRCGIVPNMRGGWSGTGLRPDCSRLRLCSRRKVTAGT